LSYGDKTHFVAILPPLGRKSSKQPDNPRQKGVTGFPVEGDFALVATTPMQSNACFGEVGKRRQRTQI